MKQCYRCQRFNHTFPGCNLTPRCLLCADAHEHEDCPIKAQAVEYKQLLKCANCNERGHVGNVRAMWKLSSCITNHEIFLSITGIAEILQMLETKLHWEINLTPEKQLKSCHLALHYGVNNPLLATQGYQILHRADWKQLFHSLGQLILETSQILSSW